MKTSSLIQELQKLQQEHGDLPVVYFSSGFDHHADVATVADAGANSKFPGAVTGPHASHPKRIVISGRSLA